MSAKNCENRLTYVKVMSKDKVGPFYAAVMRLARPSVCPTMCPIGARKSKTK